MAFFSSLLVFLPGQPPVISVAELRDLCDEARQALAIEDSPLMAVKLKYGRAINQDLLPSMREVPQNESGTIVRYVDLDWDHESKEPPWGQLWPVPAFADKTLYRAYVSFGGLPHVTREALMDASVESPDDSYFMPDSLSLELGPVCPSTLASDEEIFCGFISFNFAGYGYVSWQELSRYWSKVEGGPALQALQVLCRRRYPAQLTDDFARFKSSLGPLLLNAEQYQLGDWIVSVDETG